MCGHCIRKGAPEKLKENYEAARKGIRGALLCWWKTWSTPYCSHHWPIILSLIYLSSFLKDEHLFRFDNVIIAANFSLCVVFK